MEENTTQTQAPVEVQEQPKVEVKVEAEAETKVEVPDKAEVETSVEAEAGIDFRSGSRNYDFDLMKEFQLSEQDINDNRGMSETLTSLVMDANPKTREDLQAVLMKGVAGVQKGAKSQVESHTKQRDADFNKEAYHYFGQYHQDILGKIDGHLKRSTGVSVEDLKKVYAPKEAVERLHQIHTGGLKLEPETRETNVAEEFQAHMKKTGSIFGFKRGR